MKEFHIYNKFHLGDCSISIHFIRKLTDIDSCICFFYCEPRYHEELKLHIKDKQDKIILKSINSMPSDAWNNWYGCMNLLGHGKNKRINNINERYDMFFSTIL